MRRVALISAVALLLAATPSFAHHSYGEYDQDHAVSVTGTILQMVIGSPHTVLRLRTDDSTIYTLIWGNAQQLARWGIKPGVLHAGDRIVVTGSEMRDRSFHTMSLLTEIRRPSDGWRWRPSATPSSSAPTARASGSAQP